MAYRHHALNHYDPMITKNSISAEELARCHHCQLLAFSNREQYPIHLKGSRTALDILRGKKEVNALPTNFTFIEDSILSEGVERAEPEFRSGCECTDDGDCLLEGCSCLQDMDYDEPREDGKIYAYNYDKYTGEELLRDEVLDSRDPIYECHTSCGCSHNCRNRVVERGRMIPLDLFHTSDGRGWGVYCRFPIKRGQFIDKYVGEVITATEADSRRNASKVAKHKDIYLFALDKFTDPASNDPRLRGPPLEVDGEYFSGPTRFINHSCDPNLRIFARVGDYADKHIHDLAFFAIKDIPAETELTFDYVDGEDTDLSADAMDPKNRTRMTKCLCKSDGCRGYLW